MYRVVLCAFARTHHSIFNHARSLGLVGLGLFAAATLGSMTLGSNSAQAQCIESVGATETVVTCASDDTDGVQLMDDDPIIANIGTADPIGTLDITRTDGNVFELETTTDDSPINFNIFSDDPFVPVRIEELEGDADGDAVHLVTTTSDITFASQPNSVLIGTDSGLFAQAVTDENTATIDITSFSDITSKGDTNNNQTAAIELRGEDGPINLRQHGTTTANDDGVLITNEDATVTAEFWGVIDAGDSSEDDGVDISTDNGNIGVTLHQGANIVDAGGAGLNLRTFETGDITATVNSQIGSTPSPVSDDGVRTSTDKGNTSVVVGATGSIVSDDNAILIDQTSDDAGTDGTIDVELSGGLTTTATGDDGVDINADDSVINVMTYEGGSINAQNTDAAAHGIEINADNENGEAINVYVGDTITTAGGDGVFIDTTGGQVLVETGGVGDINVAGHGVNVTSVDGDITENIGENITAGLSAVRVGDGEVVTLNFGDETNTTKTIAGEGSDTNAVVNVVDYDQDSSLTNYSTIRSTAATLVEQANDLAINVETTEGARFDIDNYNTIIGRIDGSDGDNTVNNFSADSWIVAGVNVVNDFGDGEDIVNNFGRTVTALSAGVEESVSFINLEQYNNGFVTTVGSGPDFGLLTMIDQSVGQAFMRDTTSFAGDGLVWAAGPNSQLGIDAFLGGASDTADLLEIDGDNTGATAVRLNDINAGAGAYNPNGILFASVTGTSPEGSFFLQNGPIDKGFFTYDIIRNEAATVDWLLASAPNGRAFELPKLVTGAQTIWHETTGVWLDRTADLRRIMACAPAPVAAPVQQLPPLKLGPSGESYAAGGAPCYQQRFGVWGRAFGGDFDRSVRDRTTLTLSGSPATFKGNYNQDLAGAQGGADVVLLRENSGYGALFVGVMGGFVESDMDFKATKDKANFDGGTVGVYGTYVAGPWYADLLFKADLLDLTYKTSFQGSKASSDADSFGIRFDTGYRTNTGLGFFLDPQGTLAWVDSDVGNLSLMSSTTSFGDGESLRGRLGLRGGYSWLSGSMIVEPFAVASVWHEFEGSNKASLMSNGFTLVFNDSLDDTWGEVGGGLNVFAGGGSAFVKADALVGSDLEGWKVTGGGRLSW